MAEDAGREPDAVLWAFVVREATQGSPFAEAFVEIDERRYGELIDDALISGFELAVGDPPSTSAALLVREERLVELALAGGHRGWAMAEPPLLSADWLVAAAGGNSSWSSCSRPAPWRKPLRHRCVRIRRRLSVLTRSWARWTGRVRLLGSFTGSRVWWRYDPAGPVDVTADGPSPAVCAGWSEWSR